MPENISFIEAVNTGLGSRSTPDSPQRKKIFPTKHPIAGKSNVLMAGVTVGDKEYVIPTMVDGKKLNIRDALTIAQQHGLDKYPSFSSRKDADLFAEKYHGSIDENGFLIE
jgi:hypothetical protein